MENMSSKTGGQLSKAADPLTLSDIWGAGTTAKAWADERGFSLQLVYKVLRGERKCLRGASHIIARELGMK
jgi:gp16 family phage-associated protein